MRDTGAVVLVVDPCGAATARLAPPLVAAGCTVERVATGAAGRARLAQGDVALVLVELLLPDTSGLEWCARVREDVLLPPPLVVLSAAVNPGQRQAAWRAGAAACLSRSAHPGELCDALSAWLPRRRATEHRTAVVAGAPRVPLPPAFTPVAPARAECEPALAAAAAG